MGASPIELNFLLVAFLNIVFSTNYIYIKDDSQAWMSASFVESAYSFMQQLSVGVPLSFCYYNNNIGIGFMNKLNWDFYLVYGFNPGLYGLNNVTDLLLKFGDPSHENFFVLEGGISILSIIRISFLGISSQSYIGPDLFLGYEHHFKNQFVFAVGGTFQANFNIHWLKLSFGSYDIINSLIQDTNFSAGIEFRFLYKLEGTVQGK